MKTYLLLAAIIVATTPSPSMAAQPAPPINIVFSAENASCAAWMKSAGNKLVRGQYEFWARGFVSGYNYANPSHQVQVGVFPSGDDLYRHFDQYCRDNPQQSFVAGVIQLVAHLSEPAKPARRSPPDAAPARKP